MNVRDRVVAVRKVKASDLKPSPRNWRTHPDEQREAFRGIISEIGIAGAVLARQLADGTLELIDGHLRMEELGDREIPAVITDLSSKEADKLLTVYDVIGRKAGTDAEKLNALLGSVTFDDAALQSLVGEMHDLLGVFPEPGPIGGGGDEFDATPEASGPTRTAVGDLWLIGGKHRLLVGDNTDAKNVERLMGGKTVGLCFTSPPYAQQRDYGEAAKEKVQDWYALMCGTFANLPMAHDGQVLVNLGLIHRDGEWVPYWDGWIEWMRTQGWRRFGWYVWDQLSGFPGVFGGRCAPAHEFIWHFNHATTTAEKWVATKSEGTTRKGGSMGANGWEEDASRVRTTGAEKIPDSVWRIGRSPDATIEHSAMFPVALPTYAMQTWPGDVYDPFLGSGTTLIAAHRLGRTCYGCEIEPRYGDVILKRAEAEGLTVEKIGTSS